jgi:DNA-binding CsgD family transcriptional regulator
VAGLEAEAAIAERARAAHATSEQEEAAAIATDLLQRARDSVTAEGVTLTRMARVMLLTAEAHASRVTGRGDPELWAEVATAWEALDCPWRVAYAHWRQAEALLAAGASRDQVAPLLRQAWMTASALEARPLLAEVESLGRRARIDLAPAPTRSDDAAPEDTGDALDRLGITRREREVLALVADGRTNRQIAERLFISDRTASVHVSNILGKLGVANRAEAAVAAHRLGLTSSRDASDTPPSSVRSQT